MEEKYDSLSEENLIRKIISGDRIAFGRLYLLHFDALYRFVYSRCGNTAETEDIVSETWELMLENISRFNFSSKFRTFLVGFSVNLLRRLHASRQIEELSEEIFVSDLEEEELIEKSLQTKRLIKKIKSVLPLLKKNYQEVISKRYFEAMSLKEAAASMGVTVQNVKVMQNRAIKKIKELLK